ncbi:MAG TPA: chemotaxis protein CheW [Bradyrhizobium sp.]|nr:chemotaxis protein CheW [Bradyrhizobium sp.]
MFRISTQAFVVSSASVQEVRAVDSIAGLAFEVPQTRVGKVRHAFKRGDRTIYIVNGALHFGLPLSSASLVFMLRRTRTALLIDGIERMSTMSSLQGLSNAFHHDERSWYRGLTVLDQAVVPVINPDGFLTHEELITLDTSILNSSAPAMAAEAQLS